MNQIYSPEILQKVLDLYQSKIPVKEIVLRTGVSRSRVYAYISAANLPRQREKSDPAVKNECPIEAAPFMDLDVRKQLIDGFQACNNKSQVAQDHQISRSTLYRWSRESSSLIQAYNGKTINIKMYYEILRSNEKLRNIIEVLQSVHCTVFSPLQEKMSEMERLNDQFSHRVLCAALCVDRATYANHLKRNKRENSWFIVRREQLKQAIEAVYHEHDQIPGIRKVRALLINKGFRVSEHMVGELMKELGLSSIRNSAKQVYLARSKDFPNEINIRKLFPCFLPNQIWSSDFTFFSVGQIKYCVCIIIDLCSRMVVAHKVGKKATTQMLTQCFRKAVGTRTPNGALVFHSDQGSQYTSYTFKNLLRENDVRQSFSRKGKPTDNGEIESFNSSFKREELYRHEYLSEKKFKKAIADYIVYYNGKRPHESLNYMTPMRYEQQLLKQDCPCPASEI